jgi:predicted porin
MKKSLIALAVLSATGASFAQSSVNVYGIADVYFGSTRSTGAPTQTVVDSGGVDTSRFGFKGTEDLGGGLKANFLLEQGFSMDSGASGSTGSTFSSWKAASDKLAGIANPTKAQLQSAADAKAAAEKGQMFSRQAYVGFSGNFGEVKLGKMFTPYDDTKGVANAVFDSGLSPQINVWLSESYAANPGSSVYYATPNISGFSGALSYSLGENKDIPTVGVDAGSVTSLRAQYEGGPLYAGFAYQTEKATGDAKSLNFTRLNATYDLGVVKVLAGYGFVSQDAVVGETQETNEWQIGVDYPVSSTLKLSGGFARSSDNAAKGEQVRSGYGLGASYSLSKRTVVYGGYQSSTKDKIATGDVDTSLVAVGINHKF